MSEFSAQHKALARCAWDAFDGQEKATQFWDDAHRNWVAILNCKDCPTKGVTSYATVGTSDHPLYMKRKIYRDADRHPVRCEFVGACKTKNVKFANAMSTAAFCVINSKWFCCPGTVFPDVLSMYDLSKTMRHFYFTTPFLWGARLKTQKFGELRVAWLQAIPISDSEREFVESQGPNALEDLFDEHQIDVYNLNRKAVV